MRDTILIGADDVLRAGHEISAAADSMRLTQGFQAEELQRHRVFMDEWLERFEVALQFHAQQMKEVIR